MEVLDSSSTSTIDVLELEADGILGVAEVTVDQHSPSRQPRESSEPNKHQYSSEPNKHRDSNEINKHRDGSETNKPREASEVKDGTETYKPHELTSLHGSEPMIPTILGDYLAVKRAEGGKIKDDVMAYDSSFGWDKLSHGKGATVVRRWKAKTAYENKPVISTNFFSGKTLIAAKIAGWILLATMSANHPIIQKNSYRHSNSQKLNYSKYDPPIAFATVSLIGLLLGLALQLVLFGYKVRLFQYYYKTYSANTY